jgi:hypothetical protein
VLWSLRTTPNSSTGYTPFFLLFGAEAVLPTNIRYSAPRVVAYIEEDADKALADAQDLLDEARDVALVRSAVYQQSCYSVMAPEKRLLAWSSKSLCVVNDQPVGNPKRKV